MKAQFRVTISPADVGQRVTMRYQIEREGSGPGHSDVVGVLRSWQEGKIEVKNRHGQVVVVPEEHLVAGRVVPPSPKRRR